MSDVVIAQTDLPTGQPYLEQRLFGWSPLGLWPTAAVIFAVLYGLYLAAAAFDRVRTVFWSDHTLHFENGAWPAFVLSLLITAALTMQRFTRLRDARDRSALGEIFSGGANTAARLSSYAPNDARLGRATLVGIALGLFASALILYNRGSNGANTLIAFAWFVFAITLSAILFARGFELTRKSNASFAVTLREELKIDLLRIDKLSIIGRSTARSALVWFVVSAVACLFFVGGDIDLPSVAIMLACAAIGVSMFVRVTLSIHHKIIDAKRAELEHVRCQIDGLRANLTADTGTAPHIHGLLAYEKRIQDAPEWPFDQTTLVRVGASTLIVTVPWFGQAIVGYLVDHLAH